MHIPKKIPMAEFLWIWYANHKTKLKNGWIVVIFYDKQIDKIQIQNSNTETINVQYCLQI